MRRLFRWLRRNFRETPRSRREEQIKKTEEIYLHEGWIDGFQADLRRWSDR